ncbi:MAG: ATP-binding protein [Candidatus Auribacterota bacterium]
MTGRLVFHALFRKLFFSFRGKLLMAIFSISFVMLATLTVNRIVLTKKYLHERILNRMYTIQELLRDEISENLAERDISDLKDILELAVKQPRIEFICILDVNKTVMYSTIPENKPNIFQDSKNIKLAEDIYIKTFPLTVKDNSAGYIQIGYSLKNLSRDIKESLVWAVSIDAIALILILSMAWVVSGILLKPLSQMKDISQRIAKGDFSSKISVTTPDIIGALGGALNNMSDQLSDLTENMQRKIERATYSLDVSNKKLQQSLTELEAKHNALEKLNEEMDIVIRIVAHDIRVPLTTIIGFADIILRNHKDVIDSTVSDHLQRISNGAVRINNLIGDLLELTKISRLENPYELVDIKAVLASVIEQEDTAVAKHNVKITSPPQLPAVYCDRIKISRVFVNLIRNAIKFSSKNNPEPKIEVGYADKGDAHEFFVKDNGIGIDPKNHDEIFKVFTRLHTEREYEGTGAGLYIVRRIILDHGGTIHVDSELGKGAKFVFTIPKKTPAETKVDKANI